MLAETVHSSAGRSRSVDPANSVVFGASISIKGLITSGEDLYFDGEVEGTIEAVKSMVTIGPNAKIASSIKARTVVVLGAVQGHVVALDSIELRRSCKLVGDLMASRIMIEDGAYFKGSIEIRRSTAPASASFEVAALEERYAELVDLKYLRGLTADEEAEFDALSSRLSSFDGSFYDPLLKRLGHVGQIQEKVGAPSRVS